MPGWKGKGSDRCFSHDLQFKVQMAEERWPKCIKRGYIERVAGEEYCSNSPLSVQHICKYLCLPCCSSVPTVQMLLNSHLSNYKLTKLIRKADKILAGPKALTQTLHNPNYFLHAVPWPMQKCDLCLSVSWQKSQKTAGQNSHSMMSTPMELPHPKQT